ncbi:hypothetical protein IWX49DRAFT_486196, partial [Phyllosticta citricarpa]
QGRGLGCSSAINSFYYGRGTSTIYNGWVCIGNPEWGWDDVYPLFIKGTTSNPPVNHATKGFDTSYKTWDPATHSDGPLQICFQGYVLPSGVGFIGASAEALNISIIENYNTGNSTVFEQGTAQVDGKFARSSSHDGYLKEAIGRPNLDDLFHAPVWNNDFDTEGKPKAKGVAFMDCPTGVIHEVHAKKETIFSAGAFDSPQLLMVS